MNIIIIISKIIKDQIKIIIKMAPIQIISKIIYKIIMIQIASNKITNIKIFKKITILKNKKIHISKIFQKQMPLIFKTIINFIKGKTNTFHNKMTETTNNTIDKILKIRIINKKMHIRM